MESRQRFIARKGTTCYHGPIQFCDHAHHSVASSSFCQNTFRLEKHLLLDPYNKNNLFIFYHYILELIKFSNGFSSMSGCFVIFLCLLIMTVSSPSDLGESLVKFYNSPLSGFTAEHSNR